MRVALLLSVLLAPGCVSTLTYMELSEPGAYVHDARLVSHRLDGERWVARVAVSLSDGRVRHDEVALHGWPEPGPGAALRTRVVEALDCGLCGGVFGLSRVFPPRPMPREGGVSYAVEVQDGERWLTAATFGVAHEPPGPGAWTAFALLLPLTAALDAALLPLEALGGLLFR